MSSSSRTTTLLSTISPWKSEARPRPLPSRAMRSGVVTGSQTVNLALNGRNYLDLIKTVPGIVSDFNGQVAGPGGLGSIYANGQRGDQNNVELDGVGNVDTGSNGTQHTSLNVDAVAEFRVITNSESAEFGRSVGAAVNIITKGGTRDFHGRSTAITTKATTSAVRSTSPVISTRKSRSCFSSSARNGSVNWFQAASTT